MKIEARYRLVADASAWFNSLTEEQQQQYIELHPGSKYAKQANKGKAPDTTKPPAKAPAKVSHKEIQEFAHSPDADPHSETRRSIGQMLKAKAKGVVTHLKDEVKEAGMAGLAVGKLLGRKKLSHEEKHALKATCVRLVIVTGALAMGGGLAVAAGEGLKALAKEIANDFLAHGVINVAEKTLMHSSTSAGDEGLEKLTAMMSTYMTSSPNLQKILAGAKPAEDTSKE